MRNKYYLNNYINSPILASYFTPTIFRISLLDTLPHMLKNRPVACNQATSFDRLITLADNRHSSSGFFTSVATALPSMVGRSREALTPAGFQCTGLSTLLRAYHPRLTAGGGLLNPTLEAYIMPKLCRTLLSHLVFSVVVLAIYCQASLAVITLSLISLGLVQVIGGKDHA
jgi:hypothetical protein